jgi:hypothetical protein
MPRLGRVSLLSRRPSMNCTARPVLGAVRPDDSVKGSGISAVNTDGQLLYLGAVPPPSLLERLAGPLDVLSSSGHGGLGFGEFLRDSSGPPFEPVAGCSGQSAGGGRAAPTVKCGLLESMLGASP